MTITETVEWFNSIFELNKTFGDDKSCFYCGITSNLEERRIQHKVNQFLGTTRCDTFDTAKKLERAMHDEGYDTGKQLGNGTDESIYCYLYKKVPNVTKE